MADTFTWQIRDLHRFLNDGAVYLIEWALNIKRTNSEGVVFELVQTGETGLGAPDPDNFIPYNVLTEPEIINWLEQTIGQDAVDNMKSVLSSRVDELENPTQGRGIPWPTSEPPNDDPATYWDSNLFTWVTPVNPASFGTAPPLPDKDLAP